MSLLQSNNCCEEGDPGLGHPRFSCAQHHPFFSLDQLAFQFKSPAVQSKGVIECPHREHHSFFEADHVPSWLSRSASQSYVALARVKAVVAAVEGIVVAKRMVVVAMAEATKVVIVVTVVVVLVLLSLVVVAVVGAKVAV